MCHPSVGATSLPHVSMASSGGLPLNYRLISCFSWVQGHIYKVSGENTLKPFAKRLIHVTEQQTTLPVWAHKYMISGIVETSVLLI